MKMNFNIIWVFNPTRSKILMCKRHKQPYQGLFNLVGGKIEQGEDGLSAAYRELREETGITEADIKLTHIMDFVYHLSGSCSVEVYGGTLKHDVSVKGDERELVWISVTEDFFSMEKFAGEGNIGHIYEIIKLNIDKRRFT